MSEGVVWKSIASGAELLLSDPDDWLETAGEVTDWSHALDQLEVELLFGATVRPVIQMMAVKFWFTNRSAKLPVDLRVRFARLFLPPFDALVRRNLYQVPVYDGTPRVLWRPQPRDDLRIQTRDYMWFGNEEFAHFYAWPTRMYDLSETIMVERIAAPVDAIISHVGRWYSSPGYDMFVVDPEQLPRIETLPARQIEWQSEFGSWIRMTADYPKVIKKLHADELKSVKPKRRRASR